MIGKNFKLVDCKGSDFFISNNVSISNAINSLINFLQSWMSQQSYGLFNFLQPNLQKYPFNSVFNHSCIYLYEDLTYNIRWILETTYNAPQNIPHLFTDFFSKDFTKKSVKQSICKYYHLIGISELVPKKNELILNILDQKKINSHFLKICIENNLYPKYMNMLTKK